ncbi:WD40/YVTN/BNR-like repeat-containing protein [Faecalibacter bovis]|uniref:Photosynthesis system II assembly factor Ycf48/Hcf136-like domain-containing protein n=1 Tax=Faecalibacter bovis TaxID=2898187 RepID=A0ABX7XAR7_9FLAO|nr:YCF48-related protein [Faecalibacter bovis]MBS7333822.1 hypothetical protein [Weeksellaceae bacterium]QTV05006.1 hypothetical protein J9309_09420 [Faecalibacter bovis]
MKYLFLLLSSFSLAQTYKIINEEKTDVSFRGLAIESATNFVVSGSKNTIGKTTDGGKTFKWINPTVVQNRDFRDIEILGKDTYLAMGIDSPAYLLLTKDGGKTWTKVYENNQKGVFLDALYVDKKSKKIYALGDPIEVGKPFLVTSTLTDPTKWEVSKSVMNQPLRLKNPKEAFFASSGSNIYADENQVLIVSGGVASNVYRYTAKGGQLYSLEKSSSTTAGVNGMAYDATNNIGYMVGGDYTKPTDSKYNLYKFKIVNNQINFIDSWKYPEGYKSGVAILSKDKVIVCGYSGVDYSIDGGHNWKNITKDSYNTCIASPDKKSVILVGNKGKIGKVTF